MSLSPTIRGAIRSASVHLVIFSHNYAHLRWCLDELCWMLRSSHERKFIPIFCDVEPWELRHTEKGCYANAFHKHQPNGRVSPEVVVGWKEALREAADISGLQFKSKESDYGEFMSEIENVVTKQVKWDPLEVATHPVGLDQALKDLDDHIQKQRSTKVVGIAGVSGIGKSTLAKHMFNLRHSKFNRSSYIFNIREKVDLTYLQRQLFRDLLGKDMDIPNTNIGRTILRNSLKGLKILIVLDGVDDSQKIKCLLDMNAGEAGSLIFITYCDKDILRGSFKNTLLYDIKPLKQKHARELFCHHAFHQSNPFEGYEELEGFLKICGGLPLCLKVFGEHLAGKLDTTYWKWQLEKFSRGQPLMEANTIINALKWSYKAMEMEQREMLLDMGCFFMGEDVDLTVRVLEGLGYHNDVRDYLESLRQKCLLDFSNDVESQNHIGKAGQDIEIVNGRHVRLPPVLPHRSSKIIMQNQVRELARRISRQDLGTMDKPLCLSCSIEIEKILQL